MTPLPTLQPIVEGYGEVDAVPILLRRILVDAGIFGMEVGRPHRKTRSDFEDERKVKNAVRVARLEKGCSAILILFDADKACPADIGLRVERWAQEASAGTPCGVAVANHEYEAWLIASLEALRGRCNVVADAVSHPDPELPRGAKAYLERYLRSGTYRETVDQARLTHLMDLGAAHARCRSFRRLTKVVGNLVRAAGIDVSTWPPSAWASPHGVR